ncbi:MAG: hypothetical protein N2441_09550 [Rhodocyclaceae bacterium]|nr:hypothetical protein [Rhodocyclaceae bacterium]
MSLRPLLLAFCAAFVCLPAHAQTVRWGYAFEAPEVLAAQRIWGIAHAAKLLARACAEIGDVAAVEAWADWQARESQEITAAAAMLSRYHFGADTASHAALATVLNLASQLDLTAELRRDACATLPQALMSERYDLARRKREWVQP